MANQPDSPNPAADHVPLPQHWNPAGDSAPSHRFNAAKSDDTAVVAIDRWPT